LPRDTSGDAEMTKSRHRVLLVGSHPVQYAAPLFRLMAQHPRLDPLVAYCSLQGAEPGLDPEFGIELTWDIPLLEGYPWIHVPNRSPRPGLGRFFGLVNPGLWTLVRRGGFDSVVIFTGYRYASFWIALASAKVDRSTVLFGTDAHELRSRDTKAWKTRFKKWIWPSLFRIADVVIVPSSGGMALMYSLGLPEERVVLTPYVVNNDWWVEQADRADPLAVRRAWNVPESSHVVLFCAKFQPWKRPLDVLRAFAKANVPDSFLVFAGEGPQRAELEAEGAALGVSSRVRILGFVKQSELPGTYRAANLLVLSSEHEPFGVVVNEAMLCGCPVAVSDRVGARYDLVRPGQTGLVFPCGDIDLLAAILRNTLRDRARLQELSAAARQRIQSWSPSQNIEALVMAVERAVAFRRKQGKA